MLPFPIGTADIRQEPFHLLPEHKRRHISIFGKSGVGKTTLLRNMIVWDIYHRLGVTVIDPHGGLIDEILDCIPKERTNDVILFQPHHPTRAFGLNILERVRKEQKPLVVSSLVSILRNIWSENWGPRTEYILRNAAYALLDQPEPVSLVALQKFLTDPDYR